MDQTSIRESNQAISIQPLREDDLSAVVKIHQEGLSYSFNSLIGPDHLRFIYSKMAQWASCYVGVAYEDGVLLGVVSGTIDSKKTREQLVRSMSLRAFINILTTLMMKPSLIREYFKSDKIGQPVYFENHLVPGTLSTIVVSKEAQGKGVGRQLVKALEVFFEKQSVSLYHLDTLIENSSARRFYESLGFQEIDRRADSVILIKRIS